MASAKVIRLLEGIRFVLLATNKECRLIRRDHRSDKWW